MVPVFLCLEDVFDLICGGRSQSNTNQEHAVS